MAASGLHISISAEKLFSVAGLEVTNSIFTSLIVSTLLIVFAVVVNSQLKKTDKPTGLQNFAEIIIEALHNFIYGITGDLKKTRLFFPVISTFFMFIILNNWLGLMPGVGTISIIEGAKTEKVEEAKSEDHSGVFVESAYAATATTTETEENHDDVEVKTGSETEEAHVEATATTDEAHTEEVAGHGEKKVPIFRPGTADLNTTIALGLISIFLTQVVGVKFLGLSYFGKFFNFSSPIMFYVGILELISEFAKIISFAFRLFGNIFAGEVLLVVISSLVPVILPMPFYGLEIFVGFIQALVFSMLSLIFFNMATIGHHDEEEHGHAH